MRLDARSLCINVLQCCHCSTEGHNALVALYHTLRQNARFSFPCKQTVFVLLVLQKKALL